MVKFCLQTGQEARQSRSVDVDPFAGLSTMAAIETTSDCDLRCCGAQLARTRSTIGRLDMMDSTDGPRW